LQIEAYFQQIQSQIEACPVIQLSNIAYEKRGSHEGLVRGEITFVDGSLLHLREYVDVETTVDRLMYVYQYMDALKNLIFRYDNTGHHRDLNLSTYPHHKHDGSEDKITTSSAPTLEEVLQETQLLVHLP